MTMKAAMIGRVWVHIIPMRDKMKIGNKGRIYIEMSTMDGANLLSLLNSRLYFSTVSPPCTRWANSCCLLSRSDLG